MFTGWEKTLIRGYNEEGRIVYGTGSVIGMNEVENVAKQIFNNAQVAIFTCAPLLIIAINAALIRPSCSIVQINLSITYNIKATY